MPSYKCSNCNKEADAGDIQSCSRCGQMVCTDCGSKNVNLCRTCFSEMRYLQ